MPVGYLQALRVWQHGTAGLYRWFATPPCYLHHCQLCGRMARHSPSAHYAHVSTYHKRGSHKHHLSLTLCRLALDQTSTLSPAPRDGCRSALRLLTRTRRFHHLHYRCGTFLSGSIYPAGRLAAAWTGAETFGVVDQRDQALLFSTERFFYRLRAPYGTAPAPAY